MKRYQFIIGTACLMALVSGCALKEQAVSKAMVSTDKASLEADADACMEADPFKAEISVNADTVRVTASRSWTAVIKTEDGNGWATLEGKEHINTGGIMETSDLVVIFDRYKGSENRNATLSIYCAECDAPLVIPIVQKAYEPKVMIEAVDSPTGISSEGGECWIIVRSNTKWKTAISEEESTVVPNISLLEGEDSRAIRLDFPANPDDEMARFATLVVNGNGCQQQKMEFIQSQSERFFFLSGEVPEHALPYESSIYIPLRSNGPWSASVSECSFENGRLEPSEGLYAYSGIHFNYDNHGADPQAGEKHALVTISREGMDDIVVEFTQKGSIHLNFGHFDPEYEWDGQMSGDDEKTYKPYTVVTKVFSEPGSIPYTYTSGTYAGMATDCITSNGGYTFTMYGSDCGIYYVPGSYCFCIGKKQGDYVSFPAFEGWRLTEMYYEASCRNVTPYTIRDLEGNVIEGGEYTRTVKTIPISREYNDMHHHLFPKTEPGTPYRMVLEESLRSISIKDLCLVYEQYE